MMSRIVRSKLALVLVVSAIALGVMAPVAEAALTADQKIKLLGVKVRVVEVQIRVVALPRPMPADIEKKVDNISATLDMIYALSEDLYNS